MVIATVWMLKGRIDRALLDTIENKKTPEDKLRLPGGYGYGHSRYLGFVSILYGGIMVKNLHLSVCYDQPRQRFKRCPSHNL